MPKPAFGDVRDARFEPHILAHAGLQHSKDHTNAKSYCA